MTRTLFVFTLCLLCFTRAVGQKASWTWMAGDDSTFVERYGTKGQLDPLNSPSFVSGANGISWTDDSGDFWLYGVGKSLSIGLGHSANVIWKLVDKQWMWAFGDTTNVGRPIYGTQGVPDIKNVPGDRFSPSYVYKNGKLYLFGGYGRLRPGTVLNNDLWQWDGKMWTWINGSSAGPTEGVYGVQGIADPKNIPEGRRGASCWIDEDNNFWLFGGESLTGVLNDLWKWDGRNWTWVNGSNSVAESGVYGEKGIATSGNVPGARSAAVQWTDSKGRMHLFSGIGRDVQGDHGFLNDHWTWDGKDWTWLKGDSLIDSKGSYGTQLVPHPLNVPSSRYFGSTWNDAYGNIWLFGGALQGVDLWRWDGKNWTWMAGTNKKDVLMVKGKKGVESAQNTPGSRTMTCSNWTDSNGDLWLYGGGALDETGYLSRTDLWRFRREPFSKMVVTGNGLVIEEQDNSPERLDNTDFGNVSITNVPIKHTFYIKNTGNKAMDLWEEPVVVNGGSRYFRVVKQPVDLKVRPGDSISFAIAYNPGVIGAHSTTVVVNSKDRTEPYLYTISGVGTPPNITLIDDLSCSTVQLFIKSRNVDHYTVLISDSGKTEFPVDNANYNYSPYYLRAPVVKEHARIMYQGNKNTLEIGELVSGRSYQLVVVPGNGVAGNTTYFADSSSILYFRTPASKWQDSLQITPSADSGICETDTLIFQGSSPFAIRWNDGPSENERRLITSGEYYFLSLDTEQCWMSSDSVDFERILLPVLDSIYIATPKPWCEGDILEMKAAASHKVIWSTGEEGTILPITQSGKYSMTSTSLPGCFTKGSLSVQFNALPNAHFLADVYESYGEEVTLSYVADEANILWIYDRDTFTKESDLKISTDGEILLHATASSGCKNIDTAQVVRREVVLRAMPNAFSPNDDGLNDKWFFLHENDSGVLTVFNRWGGVMYQGAPEWDGKIFEKPVPTGIYFYHYRTEEDGKEETLSGKVQVIR